MVLSELDQESPNALRIECNAKVAVFVIRSFVALGDGKLAFKARLEIDGLLDGLGASEGCLGNYWLWSLDLNACRFGGVYGPCWVGREPKILSELDEIDCL